MKTVHNPLQYERHPTVLGTFTSLEDTMQVWQVGGREAQGDEPDVIDADGAHGTDRLRQELDDEVFANNYKRYILNEILFYFCSCHISSLTSNFSMLCSLLQFS